MVEDNCMDLDVEDAVHFPELVCNDSCQESLPDQHEIQPPETVVNNNTLHTVCRHGVRSENV